LTELKMTETPHPEQNHLLAAIPESSKPQLFQSLQLVELDLGDVIYESNQLIEFVYFPTSCIVSLLYAMLNGASAEISVIGNDGLVGGVGRAGRQQHTQPGGSSERGMRLSNASRTARKRTQYLLRSHDTGASLHPGADHPDISNRRLQSASFNRPTAMPLAAFIS
jgi:hypothetical protein